MCFYPDGVLQKRAEAASRIESDSNSNEGFRLKMDFISTFRTTFYNSFVMIRRELPVHSVVTCSPPTSRCIWTLNSWGPSWANRRQSIMGPHPSTYPSAQTQSLTHQRVSESGGGELYRRETVGLGRAVSTLVNVWNEEPSRQIRQQREHRLLMTTCSSPGGPGGHNTSADTEENFLAALVTTADHDKAVQERFQTSFTQAPEQKRHNQSSLHHHGDQTEEVRRRNRSMVLRIYSIGTCSPFGTCWEAWCSMTWWVPGWPSMWPLTSGESLNSDLVDLVRAVLDAEEVSPLKKIWICSHLDDQFCLWIHCQISKGPPRQPQCVRHLLDMSMDRSVAQKQPEIRFRKLKDLLRCLQKHQFFLVCHSSSHDCWCCVLQTLKDNLWWGLSSDLLLKMSQIQMKQFCYNHFLPCHQARLRGQTLVGHAGLQSQLWSKSRILC